MRVKTAACDRNQSPAAEQQQVAVVDQQSGTFIGNWSNHFENDYGKFCASDQGRANPPLVTSQRLLHNSIEVLSASPPVELARHVRSLIGDDTD